MRGPVERGFDPPGIDLRMAGDVHRRDGDAGPGLEERRREPTAAGVVSAGDARRRVTDGEPRAVATDESDGIGTGQRAEEGGLARGERSIRQVVRGKEAAGVHDRRLAVETAARQRADVRGERTGIQGRGGRAAGDRVAARRREVRQTEDVQRFRIGLAQEQARLVEDLDDAQEAPSASGASATGSPGPSPRGQTRTCTPPATCTAMPRPVPTGTATASVAMSPLCSTIRPSSGPRLTRNSTPSAALLMNAASSPATPSLSPRMKGELPEPTGISVDVGGAKRPSVQRKTRPTVGLLASLSGSSE